MDDYSAAAEKLRGLDLVYPAFMSRAAIAAATAAPSWPRDPDGAPLYPHADRDIDPADAEAWIVSGVPYALRLRMDRALAAVGNLCWHETGKGPDGETGRIAAKPEAWGDVIIARREVPTSYHLSVVVDDAAQGVTHVVRGQDLFFATAVHVLLQQLLGLPTPAYHHHALITDATGRKLSKSDRDTSLRSLREAGKTAADIRRMIGLDAALAKL
jgi:glutamyl-Q tRNA(Asp) synthetase